MIRFKRSGERRTCVEKGERIKCRTCGLCRRAYARGQRQCAGCRREFQTTYQRLYRTIDHCGTGAP